MPFYVQREHSILSPYFDYVNYSFNRAWRYPAQDTLGIMIKLADSPAGTVSRKGVEKALVLEDRQRLAEGVELCKEILRRYGAKQDGILLGTINAGHPGGMLPLTGTVDLEALVKEARMARELRKQQYLDRTKPNAQ